ncbi:SDR family NAD(P)-dependent oxidoreductase [Nonomuraea sp. NPDC049725]|uniref:SDR family NAD(P)-dependent oxidoreductase n=1 Tax=Nonomuraea sp. NPDC049725 TaxID=3154508 RepID=UPI003440B7B6
MTRFTDKAALITGGTSGMGLAAAHRLIAEGAHVIVTGRTRQRADQPTAVPGVPQVTYATRAPVGSVAGPAAGTGRGAVRAAGSTGMSTGMSRPTGGRRRRRPPCGGRRRWGRRRCRWCSRGRVRAGSALLRGPRRGG